MANKKIRLMVGESETTAMPKAREVNTPNYKGTLPFPIASELSKKGRTNVPAAHLSEIRKLEEEIENEPVVIPDDIKQNVVEPKAPVDIESLSPAEQEEYLEKIRSMTQDQRGEKVSHISDDKFIPRGPGIFEAKMIAEKAAKGVESPKDDNTIKVQTDQKSPEDLKLCVHCGWPVGSTDGTNPTNMDKQVFVTSVLGQNRFTKEYSLLGGKLIVTFRTLTVKENDLVLKQLMADWDSGKINGQMHAVAEATKYQLALALQSLITGKGRIDVPVLDDYDETAPQKGTILPLIVDFVNRHAMPNEPVRRMISKTYGHFIDTQQKLEVMAETADFWQATED